MEHVRPENKSRATHCRAAMNESGLSDESRHCGTQHNVVILQVSLPYRKLFSMG